MKNRFIVAMLSASIILLVSTCCKKKYSVFPAYFFTRIDTTQSRLILFINDRFISDLPYVPYLDTNTIANGPYYVFECGKYDVEARDLQGNVKSKMKVVVNWNGYTSTSKAGQVDVNSRLFSDYSAMAIDLYY